MNLHIIIVGGLLVTDKELKKLRKSELLELLLYFRKEIDSLKSENERLKRELENHSISNDVLKIVTETNSLVKSMTDKNEMGVK